MDYKKIDFTTSLGKTDENGHWLAVVDNKENEDKPEQLQPAVVNEDNMYVFEGVNYREVAKQSEIDLFDRLVINNDNTSTGPSSSSNQRITERVPRRQMTEEEKAARAAKIREAKAQRKQEMVRVHNNNSKNCMNCFHRYVLFLGRRSTKT